MSDGKIVELVLMGFTSTGHDTVQNTSKFDIFKVRSWTKILDVNYFLAKCLNARETCDVQKLFLDQNN